MRGFRVGLAVLVGLRRVALVAPDRLGVGLGTLTVVNLVVLLVGKGVGVALVTPERLGVVTLGLLVADVLPLVIEAAHNASNTTAHKTVGRAMLKLSK